MIIDIDKIANFIRAVAQEEVLPRWRNLTEGDVTEKTGPDDLVTVADKACEVALSKLLLGAYPGSAIVGEEAAETNPHIMDLFESDAPLWVIDPIDGTMGFSQGSENFDIMVALVQHRKLLAAWIYAPVTGDFYMGESGAGVARVFENNTTRLPPIAPKPLNELTGILGKKMFDEDQRKHILSAEKHFKKIIHTVCAGHDYARILRGEAQFAVYNKIMPWDHLPGLMLAAELGHAYAKWDGSPYQPGDTKGGLLVSPGPASWQKVRDILFM